MQARAAALLRQNMELQQRQSSLERRAAFQKGLMAANRDHMQARDHHWIWMCPPAYRFPVLASHLCQLCLFKAITGW